MTTFKDVLMEEREKALAKLRESFVTAAQSMALEASRQGKGKLTIKSDDVHERFTRLFTTDEFIEVKEELEKRFTGCSVSTFPIPFGGYKYVIVWEE